MVTRSLYKRVMKKDLFPTVLPLRSQGYEWGFMLYEVFERPDVVISRIPMAVCGLLWTLLEEGIRRQGRLILVWVRRSSKTTRVEVLSRYVLLKSGGCADGSRLCVSTGRT